MIKPFQYYIQERLVRKSISNISMAKSLMEKAETRLKKLTREKIEEDESSINFEDTYEALREALQALMELKGFKPYSHEAVISFVHENKLLPPEKINVIDTYRVLRNNSVYKAEKVSLEKYQEALSFTKKTLPEIRKAFEESIKNERSNEKPKNNKDFESVFTSLQKTAKSKNIAKKDIAGEIKEYRKQKKL